MRDSRSCTGRSTRASPRTSPADVSGREDESYHLSIVEALQSKGHDAFAFRVREDRLQDLANLDCDLAFNLVEEGLNNDSALEPHLPAILDVYGLPYTGGDFLSIATTLDKARTKEILGYHGSRRRRSRSSPAPTTRCAEGLGFPLIVKPLHEDASIGVFRDSVVARRAPPCGARSARSCAALPPAGDRRGVRRRPRALRRRHRAGDAQRHRDPGERGRLQHPAGRAAASSPTSASGTPSPRSTGGSSPTSARRRTLPAAAEEEIRRVALQAFELLRLRGYARVDFRLRADGRLFVLEVNANPLIGEYSVMATMAEKMGWPFPKFIHTIAVEAYRRFQRENRAVTLRKLPPRRPRRTRAAPPAARKQRRPRRARENR